MSVFDGKDRETGERKKNENYACAVHLALL